MTCLFFRNLPPISWFEPTEVIKLRQTIAGAAGIATDGVEFHLESTTYQLLLDDGSRAAPAFHGVHVAIEMHTGRILGQKKAIAEAIHAFLSAHHLERGSDIAFCDYEPGSFYFNGIVVLPDSIRYASMTLDHLFFVAEAARQNKTLAIILSPKQFAEFSAEFELVKQTFFVEQPEITDRFALVPEYQYNGETVPALLVLAQKP